MEQQQGFFSGSPKTMFYMGLSIGVGVSALIALIFSVSLLLTRGTAAPKAVATDDNPSPVAAGNPPVAGPVRPFDANRDHVRGGKDAKVTLIEYSDFECPFCKRHDPTISKILKDFPKDVRVIYRHYPLSFHPFAQKAAEASECVAKLGGDKAFWAYHDKIFGATEDISDAQITQAAKSTGVDMTAFNTCVSSGEMKARVSEDEASGNDAGVQGTPATFVNGQLVSGAIPYAQFKAQVQAAGAQQ